MFGTLIISVVIQNVAKKKKGLGSSYDNSFRKERLKLWRFELR